MDLENPAGINGAISDMPASQSIMNTNQDYWTSFFSATSPL